MVQSCMAACIHHIAAKVKVGDIIQMKLRMVLSYIPKHLKQTTLIALQ